LLNKKSFELQSDLTVWKDEVVTPFVTTTYWLLSS